MMQRWSDSLAEPLRTFMRRGALLVLAGVISVVAALSPLVTRPASAADFFSIGGGNSCAIETVGWVICPTMRSIARLADKGFTYINQSSLSIDYTLFGNDGKTFKAWEVMRNVANGLFVIVFLYFIYGYLVGRSNSTYSFKRLLPRLLIAAIAVNLSYYIAVIFVDVTNIIGDSIWNIMKSIYGSGSPVMPLGTTANPTNADNLTKLTAAAMGNAAMVWVLMPPIAAITISIAVISAAAVILIIMREAVVATLVLAAPVLIVLYLLPNVERFSAQAMRLFFQLLMLYPIIALLLGTGQIVSLATGGWNGPTAVYGGGTGSILPDIVAAAGAVVPLLGVWFLFKNLSAVMSTAGSRLSATVRGKDDDKDARVTGKATSGAASAKSATGLGRIMGRRQAFSRNRRRSSLGGSSLGGDADRNPAARPANTGLGNKPAGATDQDALDAAERANNASSEDATKKLEDLQNARIDGQADDLNVDSAVAAAEAIAGNQKDDDKGKHVTAKDLFNDLNKSHESKDKERKLSAGPAPAGSGGGQAASGSAQPTAPTVSYRAPAMAQSNNIISGSAPAPQPARVIAVPVQVDGSALLGQQNQHRPPENVTQPPISGTEEKAKARAQKYLFDTENDLEESRNREDILGHNDSPTEQPHIASDKDQKDNGS